MKEKNVDAYITGQTHWTEALHALRAMLLKSGLEETIKWGSPVYTLANKNVVGLSAFKSYVGLWFFQGALLQDDDAVLINAQEGKTVAMRQWRFDNLQQIEENESKILHYLREAIKNQKEGRKVDTPPKKAAQTNMPELLEEALKSNAVLKRNFHELTPFKQKEYSAYIAEAKRETTQRSRLEKCIPMILEGIGLNDRYRK
ncbi:YdeI/OmpD-associated family protein [Robertkochia solimangrovi]|uniref:YdeI/OmpD-associated family protein n=1 Tax=Robertkochia solimangrovi TaxID=2213046 RepID=UPI00117F53B7|nr:DUF1801 domain-containing protein [Robertkochia solimangrovi]TRZ42756.1 hypothetical protein DMZ48_11840 [Robertkochia solimangrovi]